MNEAVAIKNGIIAAAAMFGSVIANQLGGWDAALMLLIGMMAVDYITGLMVAAFWKKSSKSESGTLDSKAGFKGLCKKGVALLVVWIAVLLDQTMGTDYIRVAVVLFFVGNEGVSLLENLGLMGVPFPPAIKKALDALGEKSE